MLVPLAQRHPAYLSIPGTAHGTLRAAERSDSPGSVVTPIAPAAAPAGGRPAARPFDSKCRQVNSNRRMLLLAACYSTAVLLLYTVHVL